MTAQMQAPGRAADSEITIPVAPVQLTAAAKRRVSRKSLSLAVLVVLLGGILAFTAAQMLTERTDVLAVARDVEVGSALTTDDFVVARISDDPAITPIPASGLDSVIGMIAQVSMTQGELLTPSQIGAGSGLPAGSVLVALPLKDGQFPARGLTPGQKVLVVATPGTAGVTIDPTSTTTFEPIAATIDEVGTANLTTGLTVVDVQVPEGAGASVAALASTGNVAIIVLAGNG